MERHAVATKIKTLFFFEGVSQEVDDAFINMVTTEVGVTVGRFNFDHAVTHFEDGDVERTATEIEDGNLFIGLLIEAVGQSGCGWFVDNSLDVQAGDGTGVFGCLALGIVEIGRNGDNGVGYLFTKVVFGRLFELL